MPAICSFVEPQLTDCMSVPSVIDCGMIDPFSEHVKSCCSLLWACPVYTLHTSSRMHFSTRQFKPNLFREENIGLQISHCSHPQNTEYNLFMILSVSSPSSAQLPYVSPGLLQIP
jgi:hypothetical protein